MSLVSVIIPTYKRSDNLARAIDSVREQTYNEIEIIVVDDNDADSIYRKSTEELMNKYIKNKKIIYIQHEKNSNGAVARNNGINASTGEYIAFLDDDDQFLPSKIEEQMNYLNLHKKYDACYCFCMKYKDNLHFYSTTYDKEGNPSIDILALKSEIYTPSLIFKKKALLDIGGFNENFKRHQDYEILLKYLEKYELGCVNKSLAIVHVDDTFNHPKLIEYEKIKNLFFDTFSNNISQYEKQIQDRIYREHYFELFFISFKQFKFIKSVKYLIKAKPTLKFLYENKKKIVKILKKSLLRRKR